MKALTLRLDDDVWESLSYLAIKARLTKTDIIRDAIDREIQLLKPRLRTKLKLNRKGAK